MVQTARVTNDSGDITLDTFGFNQYLLAEGTLTSAQRDMHSGLRGASGQWDNVSYGGVMQWWPEVYELTGSINNYSSSLHSAQTPGGDRNGISTWNIFGRVRDAHMQAGIGSVQHGTMEWPNSYPANATEAKALTMRVNSTPGGQYPINAGNDLYQWAPESYLRNKEAPGGSTNSLLYNETIGYFPEGAAGEKPIHYLVTDTAQFHTRRTITGGVTLYGNTWPNVGSPSGSGNTSGQNALMQACDLTISKDNTNGHRVTAITVSGTNIISSFTGSIFYEEVLTDGGTPTGRRLKQSWVSGTCIHHAYTNVDTGEAADWLTGSLDTQTYPSGGSSAYPLALYHNGRYYTTPQKYGSLSNTGTFPAIGRMAYLLIPQSINGGAEGIYRNGARSAFVYDCMYSYTGARFKAPQDARFFFKVNDGEYVGLGSGQYLNANGRNTGGALGNATRMYYQGVHSTQTSVDYFVAGSISDNELNSEDYGLDTRDENGRLTFTTRTDNELIELLGFEDNSGTLGATTSNVITGVPTDAYVSIPMYPSPALAYPNAAGWPSGVTEGYQYCPWIYRSGTNIYIRWYAQNRVKSDIPTNVSSSQFPGVASSSVPVMWATKN